MLHTVGSRWSASPAIPVLAEAGTPCTSGGWIESMRGEEMPGLSAFLQVGNEVFTLRLRDEYGTGR